MEHSRLNIIVAISGRGRSLENLIKHEKDHSYHVAGVISSSAHCLGNKIAQQHQIPLFIVNFNEAPKAQQQIDTIVYELKADLVALAGFLKRFPISKKLINKIINIHPALLPKYGGQGMYGDFVHQAVLQHKEHESGASIHIVDDAYDHGPVIAQAKVKVYPNDTATRLAERVFEVECQLYPQVLTDIACGQINLNKPECRIYEFSTLSSKP